MVPSVKAVSYIQESNVGQPPHIKGFNNWKVQRIHGLVLLQLESTFCWRLQCHPSWTSCSYFDHIIHLCILFIWVFICVCICHPTYHVCICVFFRCVCSILHICSWEVRSWVRLIFVKVDKTVGSTKVGWWWSQKASN